jgi:hypothetical protein
VALSAAHFGIVGSGAAVEVATAVALYGAVTAFRRGRVGVAGRVDVERYTGDSGYLADAGDAKSAAAADWASASPSGSTPLAATSITRSGTPTYAASMLMQRIRTNSSLAVDTRVGRQIRIYAKGAVAADDPPYYYDFGAHGFGLALGTYRVYTNDTKGAGENNAGTYPGSAGALTSWPATPSETGGRYLGFSSSAIIVIDWSFDF